MRWLLALLMALAGMGTAAAESKYPMSDWATWSDMRTNKVLRRNECAALWFDRSAYYAWRGHCFKSTRALIVFGDTRHGDASSRIEYHTELKIKAWKKLERRLRCNRIKLTPGDLHRLTRRWITHDGDLGDLLDKEWPHR